MLAFVREVNKIKPFSEVINNLHLFVTMSSPL
jgi:acyl-CoA oxidase